MISANRQLIKDLSIPGGGTSDDKAVLNIIFERGSVSITQLMIFPVGVSVWMW